jgi:hypothetical protein
VFDEVLFRKMLCYLRVKDSDVLRAMKANLLPVREIVEPSLPADYFARIITFTSVVKKIFSK